MSQIPQLLNGNRLEHDAVSEKAWLRGRASRCQIFSDFVGGGSLPLASGTTGGFGLVTQDTSAGGTPTLAFLAEADGVFRLKFSNTDEAQNLTLYLGDGCCIPATANPTLEARVKITGTFSADDRLVVGFASARNATLDNIADHAWFRMEGANNNILIEGDDNGTTDTNDIDTGADWASGTYVTLKIDMSDLSAVKYFIDGQQVTTTINVGGMDSAALLQPFIEIQKDAGTVEHSIDIDWIDVRWDRGSN